MSKLYDVRKRLERARFHFGTNDTIPDGIFIIKDIKGTLEDFEPFEFKEKIENLFSFCNFGIPKMKNSRRNYGSHLKTILDLEKRKQDLNDQETEARFWITKLRVKS